MRVLKTILIILGAIVVLTAVLIAMAPDEYRCERSVVIDAPPSTVYPHISSLAAMDKWSPWNEYDPNMKKSMEGTDGTVGAKSMWEGNEDVGKGEQTITALKPDQGVELDLKFLEPWQSQSKVAVDLVPEGEGTKATWSMSGENDMMGKFFGLFMDMDAMIGKDFEKGLAMLKDETEKAAAADRAELAAKTSGGYIVETIEHPETVYVGRRNKKVKWDGIGSYYATTLPAVGAAIGAAKLQMAGAPSGIYWEWNEKDQTADILAGMPVKGDADIKVPGFETHVVPASKMLMIAYYGDYAASGKAHEAMDAFIKDKGMDHYGNVIEEYVTDPMSEPDTTKWLTNIYYMVK
jgi:effector-binding domain-containing protein/uncharacterized protein YndB with AHSA1/START domain